MIYLDHNATTPISPAARAAMLVAIDEIWANPSSRHGPGERARALLEDARERVAAVLGARPTEIVFTSGATESIDSALRGCVAAARGAPTVITTAVEHSATVESMEQLRRAGAKWEVVGVDESGVLDIERLAAAVQVPGVALVSCIAVNNETGVLTDLDAVIETARAAGVPVHFDAAQLAGKGISGLAARGGEFISLSGHKFGAPKGTGVLRIRRGARHRPVIPGHHERGRRGGTENLPGIAAMAAAIEEAESAWRQRRGDVERLRDRFEAALIERIPAVIVPGKNGSRIENTSFPCFRGIEGEAVVLTLSARGVYCSSGSACLGSVSGPSPVLEAMRVPGDYIHGAVRFSLGTATTEAEIDSAVAAVVEAVAHVRRVGSSS